MILLLIVCCILFPELVAEVYLPGFLKLLGVFRLLCLWFLAGRAIGSYCFVD
jgi:hypothetical protein